MTIVAARSVAVAAARIATGEIVAIAEIAVRAALVMTILLMTEASDARSRNSQHWRWRSPPLLPAS
jgi:hypothetical protein